MSQLRTLKEFEDDCKWEEKLPEGITDNGLDINNIKSYLFDDLSQRDLFLKYIGTKGAFNSLKQEAINHIKELRKLPDFNNPKEDLEKVHKEKLDEKLFALFDASGSYDNSNVIKWIKWFFEIIEEDLK